MCGELIATKAIKCRFCGEILDASMRGMIQGAGDVADPGWRRVRTGLATLYYCTVIILIAAIVMIAGAGIGWAIAGQGGNDPPIIAILFLGVGMMVIFGAALGTLVGQIMCLNVPESSGAKGFIIGAVVCIAANFVLSLLGAAIPPVGLLGNLASLVGSVLFLLFIRQSAIYFGNQQLADGAIRFLIFGVVAVVGAIGLGVMAAVSQNEAVIGILVIAGVVCAIVYFVWYLRLIKSLMETIDQQTAVR
jgi:hypothetical protein